MATWDSADLLSRCKATALRPDTDQGMTDAKWYALLTEAQADLMKLLATHCPESQYGVPVKLTTADSGYTYSFPSDDVPLGHVELRQSPTGRVLVPGPEWDMSADFCLQGNKIRWPGQKAKTFTDGPYARYVADPGDISGSSEPVVNPPSAGAILVYRAVGLWARRGGLRDPRPYEDEYRRLVWGDDGQGREGLIAALKNQYQFSGTAAFSQGGFWWNAIDTGDGYVVQR